jgi:hypothetical protein
LAPVSRHSRRRERPEEPRGNRLKVSYNDDELTIVQEAAARSNMAPASWIARAAFEVATEVVVPVSEDAKDVVQELIQSRAQLARIGNNLNQAAYVLNSGGTVTDAQLAAVLERVEAAVKRVDEATLQVMRERRPRS